MEEGQWLLLQDQEHSVQQFQIFGEVVKVVEDNQWWCPAAFHVADSIENAMVVDSRDQLFYEEC